MTRSTESRQEDRARPAGTKRADVTRQIIVAVTAVVAIAGSFIGSGAFGGTPVAEASGGALAADATPVAPAGPAFAIWSLIYLGLVAYAVWQALPAQRADARQRRLGYLIAASLVLNAVWILAVQFDQLWLTVPVIVLLLVVLIRIFALILASKPKNVVDTIVTDGTVGLYLGWVCVATAANIAAVLTAAGFSGWGISADAWGAVVAAVAGLVGVGLALWGRGRLAPTITLSWGLVWIAVARLSGDPSSTPTAIVSLVAVALVFAVTAVARARSGEWASSRRSLSGPQAIL